MGYYFQKARSVNDLNDKQQERYQELYASKFTELDPELRRRYEVVKGYIGPLYNGETWAALDELIQDSLVTWILADEDLSKVEWSEPENLVVHQPVPTEEEQQASAERWAESHPPETPEQYKDRQLEQIKLWGFCLDYSVFSRWERLKLFFGLY